MRMKVTWLMIAAAPAAAQEGALGSLLNLPSPADCADANKSALIVGVVIGVIAGLLGAGLIKLLESRMLVRNDAARLAIAIVLATAVAVGVDFVATRQDDVLQQCLGAIDLCRVMTLCGKAQALRSTLIAGLPAAVVVVIVTVARGILGRRK